MGIMAEVAHFLSSSSSSTQRAPNSLKLLLDPSNATVCEAASERKRSCCNCKTGTNG